MDYEKIYKQALERAKALYDNELSSADTLIACEAIFPELAESEDEKIKKELIAFLKENHETGRADETWSLSGIERWIAWLEKQGSTVLSNSSNIGTDKQKPTDNVEPKLVEQNPAWSEDDEYIFGETIQHLEELIRIEKIKHLSIDVQYYQRDIDWLKTIKQRLGG